MGLTRATRCAPPVSQSLGTQNISLTDIQPDDIRPPMLPDLSELGSAGLLESANWKALLSMSVVGCSVVAGFGVCFVLSGSNDLFLGGIIDNTVITL